MHVHPLSILFLDCDSFFASVEQHLEPSLQGRPVGVAPVLAETSCCIAASYEAKAFGVKTGTPIWEARTLCPGITIVEAKPAKYVEIHHQVIDAMERCIHVDGVLSIDEMWAWLPYNLRERTTVEEIGRTIKTTVARDVSPMVKVSIGVGPNRWLAKMASKMRKPDGLFVIEATDLPQVLHPLDLRDLHGVARGMETRLHAAGIHSVADLCAAPKQTLHRVWGGVLGDRFWHLLRGDNVPDPVSSRKTLGHSHVLPPLSRPPEKAWPIACKLLHKTCERLRSYELLAGLLTLQLRYTDGVSWKTERKTEDTDATLVLMRLLTRLWRERPNPRGPILQIHIVLSALCERQQFTPLLFPLDETPQSRQDPDKLGRLDAAMDSLRRRYGRKVVYFGTMQDERDAAPMRIAFTHIPDPDLEED